jgi:diguanylate cyclase (GGDEF)-like protein/PAS domain S-box-containing protein
MSRTPLEKLLLIEDNAGDARLFSETLSEQNEEDTALVHLGRMSDAEAYLAENTVDIILLDIGLPDVQGLEAVRRAHAAAPRTTLVVLTGLDDESLAARALQEGAQDYLVKGQMETRSLVRSLRFAVERKGMEEALFAEKERAQITLNSIADAVVCTNILGNISFLNLVAETMTGWSLREALGRPTVEVLVILDAATRAHVPDPMERAVRRDETSSIPSNSILVRRDGSEVPIEDSVAPIHDSYGKSTGAVIVFHDVSAARAMAAEAAHLAAHDFLTGLPNRMLLNDRIDQAIAAAPRNRKSVAVLFIDLDGFKHINDSLGHSIGDKLLQSIARRLVRCVRGSDTVSRQGGDEFVVLLSEVDQPRDVTVMVKRILRTIAEPHSISPHDLHITASIGVSDYPGDGVDAETLIKNADTAMYQAKDDGRQGFRFFKPIMNVRAVERQSIEEGLRRALERDEFVLHYQPKVDLRTGQISGAEALIRWIHPGRGFIPPLQFVPVAEECGLIVPIGNWVLREACRQARAWLDAGLPLKGMAVNVSAVEFHGEKLLDRIFGVLADTGLDPKYLELELTESVLMKNAESAAFTLKRLRDKGVRLAIDDFGTGYSSLSYLRKFPIDSLKIDQSFVRHITTSPDETSLVTAVISMGRSLNLRVIAEGVQTREELIFLQERHCDEAQGYYFSEPVVPAQFVRLFEDDAFPEALQQRRRASSGNGARVKRISAG